MVTDTLTHSLTNMPHNDPAQYTVLGWVKIQHSLVLVEFSLKYCKITTVVQY